MLTLLFNTFRSRNLRIKDTFTSPKCTKTRVWQSRSLENKTYFFRFTKEKGGERQKGGASKPNHTKYVEAP